MIDIWGSSAPDETEGDIEGSDLRFLAMAATWQRLGSALSRWVPMTLFQSGGLTLSPRVVRIDSLPLDTAVRTQLRSFAGRSRAVCLSLDPGIALSKRVTIPRAAAAQRDRAVSLNIRQTMPNQGRGLVWRSIPVEAPDTQIDYMVYMFKDAMLLKLANDARNEGVSVESIVLAGFDVQPVWELHPESARRKRFWLAATLLGILGIAVWSTAAMERRVSALTESNLAADARVAVLQERLVAMRAEQEAGAAQQNATLTDLAQFNAQARRLSTLTALTDTLPDPVWISELSITGDTVLMSGFAAGDVAEIVTLLQAQNWATAVRLEGPITYDSYSGQNRFDLGFQIVAAEVASP
jgi:general secretion pathway protein L